MNLILISFLELLKDYEVFHLKLNLLANSDGILLPLFAELEHIR